MRYLITCKCLCMCMCTYMYICVCICVFCVIICKGICKNEGVYRYMVSLCIYICIYMYVNVNVHVHVHVLYLYLYIQSMGNRWKGPVGGSPTIPTHSPTIGYDSPTITTSGSWVEGEPVFWWKKNRFTKHASNLDDKTIPWQPWLLIHLETKWLKCRFSVPEARNIFQNWQGDDGCIKGGNGDALAANIVEVFCLAKTKTTPMWGLKSNPIIFLGLICGIFLVLDTLPETNTLPLKIDDFRRRSFPSTSFAGGF